MLHTLLGNIKKGLTKARASFQNSRSRVAIRDLFCSFLLKYDRLSDGTYLVSGKSFFAGSTLRIPAETVFPRRQIKGIAKEAFKNSDITIVTISDGIEFIEDRAFMSAAVTEVRLPNTLKEIGSHAFDRCRGLSSLVIPGSVTTIRDCAFADCVSLTSVVIPKSVTFLGRNPFRGCMNLVSIVVEPGDPCYYSENNCIIEGYERRLIAASVRSPIPKGIKILGWGFCCGDRYVTPFLYIPDGVNKIENGAFYGCTHLEEVYIPDSVTSIGNNPFYGCSALIRIMVTPNNPAYFSTDSCLVEKKSMRLIAGWEIAWIPKGVQILGKFSLWHADHAEPCKYTLPRSVHTIESFAFCDCTRMSSITIPDSVKVVQDLAFSYCTGVTINCEHPCQPATWHVQWNRTGRPVVWNYTARP